VLITRFLNFLGKSVFMSTNYLVKIFSLLGLLLLRVYGSVQVNLVLGPNYKVKISIYFQLF
jgi:hypothetical protein